MKLYEPTEFVKILKYNDCRYPLLVNQSNPNKLVAFGQINREHQNYLEENGYEIEDIHTNDISYTTGTQPPTCCDYPMIIKILNPHGGSTPTSPLVNVKTKCTQCGRTVRKSMREERL
jgi:hypothetical protein